jgi:hypothetical protein
MANQYDFSDLAPKQDQKYDFSDLAPQSQQQFQMSPSNMPNMKMNPIASFGSGLTNLLAGAGDALTSTYTAGLYNPQGGSGPAYNIGKGLGNIGGFLAGGELLDAARLGSEALPYIGQAAKAIGGSEFLPTAVRHVLGGSIYGTATNPEDRLRGMRQGGLESALFETAPVTVRLLGKGAEFLNPQKFTNSLVENIKNDYGVSKELASNQYEPVRKQFGESKIIPSLYNSLGDEVTKYYGPAVKKVENVFLKEPIFENAHKLQQQLGIDASKIKNRSDPSSIYTIDALKQARDSLRNDMFSFLNSNNPEAAQKYQIGTDIFRDFVAPYKSSKLIKDIAEGNKENVTPKQLLTVLGKMKETGAIQKGHNLYGIHEQLANKVNKGNIGSNLASILGGAGVGEFMAPGLGGGVMGAMAGKFAGPTAINLASNPTVQNAIGKTEPYYSLLSKALLANIIPGNNTGGQQ